jgi:Rrf2 family protein
MLSQKCQYAVRAIFELAKRYGPEPVNVGEIAQAQAIPARFLEVILVQLKQGGFVESRRGNVGGYLLRRKPGELSVGEVIRFVEGPLAAVGCMSRDSEESCSLHGRCVFLPMWEKATKASSDVYDGITFESLIEQESHMGMCSDPSYAI